MGQLRPKISSAPGGASITQDISRKVREGIRLSLVALAAGRCEFEGCNSFLFSHHITGQTGVFGQVAHIVAFKPNGARGRSDIRPEDINNIDNLMLLCPACHKLVDDQPLEYPRELLETFKQRHETRVWHVTGLGPECRTATLIFQAPIGGQRVQISRTEVFEALLPRHAIREVETSLDLNNLMETGENESVYRTACEMIDSKASEIFREDGPVARAGHLSVFAIAPIPQLIYLGSRLSNKVPTDFFQRHRDTESWKWKDDGPEFSFKVIRRRKGLSNGPIALLLPLSGSIATRDLPQPIQNDAWLYEIRLEGLEPAPTFLCRRADLESFRKAFQEVLGRVIAEHGLVEQLHLFPAVPAPVAVLCGRERLPKAHPRFLVYDRANGAYHYKIEIK